MDSTKTPHSPCSSPTLEAIGIFHQDFHRISIPQPQQNPIIDQTSGSCAGDTSSRERDLVPEMESLKMVPESPENIWKQFRKNRDSNWASKAIENDDKQHASEPEPKDFHENHKSVPMSEENAEFIKSFNETLKAPYRLSYVPPIPKFGLLFWTQNDFYYLKSLIKLNPNLFYHIPILPAAENLSDPYYYHKELKKLAVKAAFRAGTAVTIEDPLPYPKYDDVYPKDMDAVWMDTGVIGEHCFPQAQSYSSPMYPTPVTSKLEATYDRHCSPSVDDSILGFQTIVAPHLMHQYSRCNFEYTSSVTEENHYLNLRMIMPPEELSSPPHMDYQCCASDDFHKALVKKLSESDLTRQNEATATCDGEQNSDEPPEDTKVVQVKSKKELYQLQLYSSSNMEASYSAVAGAGLTSNYKKYTSSDNDNIMYSGLLEGFNKLLGKRGSSSYKTVTDFELVEESFSSLTEEFNPIVISDEAMKSKGLASDNMIAFNKRLKETLGSSTFSQDDCADSRTSRTKIRRKSSHSRSRSLSPSPEEAIRKFLLLCPFSENVECVFCKGNSQTEEVYRSHPIRDKAGIVICPYLRKYVCLLCNATGDTAHTIKYCPFNKRGFYAKRENFPPFTSGGQKENISDPSTKSLSLSVSPVSSIPISNESSKSKTRQSALVAINGKSVKGRKLDFSNADPISKCDCSSSCTSGAIPEVKDSSQNLLDTDQSMITSESITDNSTFFKQLDKIKKSAKKLWKAGRS